MAKLTTEFKCVSVEHRQENEQIIILTPVASDSKTGFVSEVRVSVTSEKNEFEEGCVYDLTISDKVKEKEKTKKQLAAEAKASELLAKEEASKEEAKNAEKAPLIDTPAEEVIETEKVAEKAPAEEAASV